jgi:hypothetical protein
MTELRLENPKDLFLYRSSCVRTTDRKQNEGPNEIPNLATMSVTEEQAAPGWENSTVHWSKERAKSLASTYTGQGDKVFICSDLYKQQTFLGMGNIQNRSTKCEKVDNI